jgi:hypothetical protein
MYPTDIPVGEKRVITDNSNIKVVFTRISNDYSRSEHIDPVSGRVVLSAKLGNSGSSEIEYVDHGFWAFQVNGIPLSGSNLPQGKWSVNVETRTINIRT